MAVIALPLAATNAFATTAVTVKNPGGLTAVGPVNAENGFPAWYQDSRGTRLELCLDGSDPMCGLLPADGYDPALPTVFPTDTDPGNFPDEAFYMAAGSTIDFPATGGRAVLTLALEAAFANTVTNGDQMVFARQPIFVTDGPSSTTITFTTPYGTISVDTDDTGKGRITEDISPAAGNFQTPLKGNVGPFLTWDTGLVTGPNGNKYIGDPNVEHAITGSPKSTNAFVATWPGGTITQPLFSLQGKVATNTGTKADAAVVNGNFLDVFATSEADAGEVYVAAGGGVPSTPMLSSTTAAGPKSFYARIDMTGKTMPTSVTVRNIGDNPVSTSQVDVTTPSRIAITDAGYDGTTLKVAATAPTGTALSVTGFPTATFDAAGVATIATSAPPAQVTVTGGGQTASAPVRITDGPGTPAGLEPSTAAPDPGPVCEVDDVVVPCPAGGVPADATPAARVAPVTTAVAVGDTVALDGSTSTNATSYEWTRVSGPQVQITNGTSAKPAVRLLPYDPQATPLPTAARNAPAVLQLVAVNGATRSTAATVSIPVKAETTTVTSSRFRAGNEMRIDGTSTLAGGPLILSPATTVAVFVGAGQPDAGKLVGTAQVDTTGAWSAVASRGGYATFTGGTTR